MGSVELEGVSLTPLKIVSVENGNILHAMKINDKGYEGFGEAYFSCVNHGAVKAWKRHRSMTLNLVVPIGSIRFVMFDDRVESKTKNMISEMTLSQDNYYRLTIPPMIWVGFQGITEETNMLLNIANIKHEAEESERKEMEEINFNWKMN